MPSKKAKRKTKDAKGSAKSATSNSSNAFSKSNGQNGAKNNSSKSNSTNKRGQLTASAATGRPALIQLSNLCALAIIPPRELWPQFQRVRAQYDKNHQRWPPHINLAFPFVSPARVQSVLPELQACFKRCSKFRVTCSELTWLVPPDKKKVRGSWISHQHITSKATTRE